MKKIVACLLSVCLCMQGTIGARASIATDLRPTESAGITIQEVSGLQVASPSDAAEEYSEQEIKDTAKKGSVGLELKTVIPVDGKVDLDIFLESANRRVAKSGQISIAEVGSSSKWYSGEIPVGRYTLTISGQGYETYKQEVKVDESLSNILVMNGYLDGYTFSEDEKHPGVLRMGDMNGDGKLDPSDVEIILDSLEDGADTGSDLNSDGKVDLLDMQYFSQFYKDNRDNKASIVRNAMINQVVATASNAELVGDGSVEGVFANDAVPVTIKSANDQVISETNPVELSATIDTTTKVEAVSIVSPVGSENTIDTGEATVVYVDENGVEQSMVFLIESQSKVFRMESQSQAGRIGGRSRRSAVAKAERNEDGTIILNLGGQVAIKKVSIKVTAATGSGGNLVDISKVEFLNDMKDRIPEPNMNIPTNLKADERSEEFTLTWKKQVNVKGYQVKLWKGDKASEDSAEVEYLDTNQNKIDVTAFKNDKLINGDVYTARVQSVNGDWKGGFSDPLEVIPRVMERPEPPENASITGRYRSLDVSWKAMKDTDSYTIFYRPFADTTAEYQSITNITTNRVTIENLLDETEYTLYLIGHNVIGNSNPSKSYRGTTVTLDPPNTPNYKLINVPVEGASSTAHINKVTYLNNPAATEFAVVDNDYSTSWVRNDWDAGVDYPANNMGKAPIIEFDNVYKLDTIIMVPDENQRFDYAKMSCYYWPESDSKPIKVDVRFSRKTSTNGKKYYELQTDKPIEAKKIQINMANGYGTANRLSIAELKFYYYDSMEDDINALFADDMHISLKTGVAQADINQLRGRLEEEDPVSGEKHPKKAVLGLELDTAEAILTDGNLNPIMPVDTNVTKRADGNITFLGGLNSWQPLGVTGLAGEELIVYVGSPGKKTGDSTNVRLITTQYYGESSAWHSGGVNLKVGPNKITIPQISSVDAERGGQLYIDYVGQKSAERYSVRVSGGSQIPMLDITKASDSNEAKALVKKYVEELEAYVPEIMKKHQEKHAHEVFNNRSCVLGATDIVTRFSMLSVSSDRILSGLKGNTNEKAEQLYKSLVAMDEMIQLFYQHKGFGENPIRESDRLPVSRLNIRYQRMFAGAFMYAGGLHIGIEWDSVVGLSQGVPVVSDGQGKYVSGEYFGWGIAHEIGHIINEGAYTIAEVTNNYFSVLSQARDTNDSVRFSYDSAYEKVTSGVRGRSSDVFTQLALYWQLHLAYDRKGYNYKTFDDHKEQLDNLFFGRVDSYARNLSLAPKPGGIALTFEKADTDNKLMRLACAAAEKNILEFFERWGMVPDDITRSYAAQFGKESRAIWFVNDEARVYAMENPNGSIASSTKVSATLAYDKKEPNKVKFTIKDDASDKNAMLGYEIYRSEYIKDRVIRKPVGFITSDTDTYIDTIAAIDNRVFMYDVVGYDKYLNATERFELNPIKISHGGFMNKAAWSVTTNMISDDDAPTTEEYPEVGAVPNVAIGKVADDDKSSSYTGKSVNKKTAPEIIINLNNEEVVTGIVYSLEGAGTPITSFEVYVSTDGAAWTKAKQGTFAVKDGQLENGSQTVYFNKEDDSWLYTYDASYVKLVATKQKGVDISIGEIDILGESGDNVEFVTDGIGTLKTEYVAGVGESGATITIPKGSLIFTGKYKGNPAYNTVLLYDDKNQIVGATNAEGEILAYQLIFAKVPEHGELGEVSEGTWVYYIEPNDMLSGFIPPAKVRAELYRVDNAETNNGERLVSDTLYVTVPTVLPEIEITASSAYIKGQ